MARPVKHDRRMIEVTQRQIRRFFFRSAWRLSSDPNWVINMTSTLDVQPNVNNPDTAMTGPNCRQLVAAE